MRSVSITRLRTPYMGIYQGILGMSAFMILMGFVILSLGNMCLRMGIL